MLEREESWRLKSRAIWLECGDENTKFFHAFARGRKAANTIWCLKDEEGLEHFDFEGKARCGVNHFESLFRAPAQASIAEVIRVAQMFPRFAEEEDNRKIYETSDRRRIKGSIGKFSKRQEPWPGWVVD